MKSLLILVMSASVLAADPKPVPTPKLTEAQLQQRRAVRAERQLIQLQAQQYLKALDDEDRAVTRAACESAGIPVSECRVTETGEIQRAATKKEP